MKTIDRVMTAYSKVYELTDQQTHTIRKELSHFIEHLLRGRAGSSENQIGTPPE